MGIRSLGPMVSGMGSLSDNDANGFEEGQNAAEDLENNKGGVEDIEATRRAHYESIIPKILSGIATPEEREYFYNSALGQRM